MSATDGQSVTAYDWPGLQQKPPAAHMPFPSAQVLPLLWHGVGLKSSVPQTEENSLLIWQPIEGPQHMSGPKQRPIPDGPHCVHFKPPMNTLTDMLPINYRSQDNTCFLGRSRWLGADRLPPGGQLVMKQADVRTISKEKTLKRITTFEFISNNSWMRFSRRTEMVLRVKRTIVYILAVVVKNVCFHRWTDPLLPQSIRNLLIDSNAMIGLIARIRRYSQRWIKQFSVH